MLYFTRIHFAINRFPAFTDCRRKSRFARNVRRCVSMTNCVQPSTAAVNVTLLAFAAAAQLLLGAGRAAIDRYRLPVRLAHSGKPAARCRQFGQTDGQTDGHRTITQSLPHTLAISANLAS